MFASLKRKLNFHPMAWLDSLLTYPRFMGRIKPQLIGVSEKEALARLQSWNKSWEVTKLKIPIAKRIVVISPHPDDETIGVGGLLCAHRGKSEIHIVNVFKGETGGQLENSPWENTLKYKAELAIARRKEFEIVTSLLGISHLHYLDLNEEQYVPQIEDAKRLNKIINSIKPDIILIPWFLDNQEGHRIVNILYSWGCSDINCVVLGFEIWTLCQPNVVLDISDWLEEKVQLINKYKTQNSTINYSNYVRGLAVMRAFLHNIHPDRGGAAEAFFSLPNKDYCDIVQSLYGNVDRRR